MTDNNDGRLPGDTRIFPPYLLWFVTLPAIPFLFSTAALTFLINDTVDSNDSKVIFIKHLFSNSIAFLKEPVKTLTHLSDLLTYLSITALHGIASIIVIGFFLYQIQQLPKALIKRSYLYITITTVTFSFFAYVVHMLANNLMLAQLGYKSICILLSMADLQTSLVWPDTTGGGHTGEACFLPKTTRLVWLAYSPIFLGVLAIIFASAFTTVMASQKITSDDEQWRPIFLSRIKLLQKSFYLLSLVLVTSTVTILLFSSLPLNLLTDLALKAVLSKFVTGISFFWGGLFTATLFATFAPAVLLLTKQARDHNETFTGPSNLGQWLNEFVFVSMKKQLMLALTIISPMLIGPFGGLLQNLLALG